MGAIPYASSAPVSKAHRLSAPMSLFFLAALMGSIPVEQCTILPFIGSFSRLVGILATAAVLLDATILLGFRRAHIAHAPLALWVVWCAWTCLWSEIPQLTSERITTNLQLLFLVWLIWQSVREQKHLRLMLAGWVVGSACAALLTLVNRHGAQAADDFRLTAGGIDPNELGLVLVLSLPMSYFLSRTATRKFARWAWLVPIPLCLAAVVMTASRGASFTALVALLCISVWHVKTAPRMRFAPLIAGVVLLAIGLAFAPKANLERISTFETEVSTGHVGSRGAIWLAGLKVFREHPFTGVGAATFDVAVEPLLGRTLAAHNVYISVLTETGIPGLALFLLALGTCIAIVWHLTGQDRVLWIIVMSIWCIGVMSLTFEYKKATWAIFGMVIATAGISEIRRVKRFSR